MAETSRTTQVGEIAVVDNEARGRFEALVDGVVVGFAEYRRRGTQVVFPHTVVHDEGKGIGTRLVRGALDAVRARREAGQDLTVVPLCSFVAGFVAKNPEYADLTR